MSLETVELACRRVFESPLVRQDLMVAWHAGEPLTVPISWYEQAMALMARLRPAGLQLKHRFQTNGLLMSEAWAAFLAKTQARIGLSIDGPADLHDANRRTRGGRGTHERAMQAVRILQHAGLEFDVITVLTERALDEPDRLFEFYVQNGIRKVGFNIEEIEGVHAQSSLHRDVEDRFRRFIRRFFELAWHAPGLLEVRELQSTLGILLSDEPVSDEQNVPFAIVSVGYDGTLSTFSPELLGTRHGRFGSFAFGHVARDGLSDLERSATFQEVRREIRRGVNACQRQCPYFRWCGGGAPANKLFETGRFDTTETMHCRFTRQIIFDEVLTSLETGLGAPGPSPPTTPYVDAPSTRPTAGELNAP